MIGTFVLAALALAPGPPATCYGDTPCNACSSCEYCGHCSGGGGTCGVCARARPSRRQARLLTGTRASTRVVASTRRNVPTARRKLAEPARPRETILAVDGLVVGSSVGRGWTPAGADFARRHPALAFRPFGLGKVGAWDLKARISHEDVDGGNYLSSSGDGTRPALLAGPLPRAPRRVETLGTDSAGYRSAVAAFLANHGLAGARFEIARAVRADLDGDGTQEVLLEARSGPGLDAASSASAPKGAFSLVLLRFVSPRGVSQVPLEFSRLGEDAPLELRRIRAIADVDGDGSMEIVTGVKGFEWQDATLWSYRRGVARRLVTNGAGV